MSEYTVPGVDHHVSGSCQGEQCGPCHRVGWVTWATHKVGEEIPFEEARKFPRHNLTQYVCCRCFTALLGPATPCRGPAA